MVPALLLTAAFLLLIFWGWYSSGLVLRTPREPVASRPDEFGLAFQEVSLVSSDGTPLKGWFVPSPRSRDVTLLICHGRGGCRSTMLASTASLASRGGYNLFYLDFRNHGESGGTLTSFGRWEMADLEAAMAWLRREKPDASRRLGLHGVSMGAAVGLLTASHRTEIAAIAAESSFSSLFRSIVRYGRLFYRLPRWMSPYTLLWVVLRLGFNPEPYSPERCIARIAPRPVFLLQGGADVRMPPAEGETLFARAGEPKTLWTVPGADHAGLWEAAGREYEDRLRAFFDGVFGPA